MNLFLRALLLIITIAPLQVNSSDEAIVVIVNSQNKQLIDKQMIKNIYSDLLVTWDNGEKINILNLPVDSAVREQFSQSLFGKNAQRVAADEANRKITNTIKNPTKTKRARLMVLSVSRDKNAIGYTLKSNIKQVKNIRILMEIN